MQEKYIDALRKLKGKPITNKQELEVWKSQATNILTRIFGPDSQQVRQVQDIQYRSYPSFGTVDRYTGASQTFGGGSNVDKCERQAHDMIDVFTEEIETFGLPPEPKPEDLEDRISITVNQNQNVNVNTVLRVFQQELTGRQIEELKEILEAEEEPERKRQKLTDKLKSFGNDVAANIIAGILTNPQILGLF